jgi:hypothetical protein
VPTVAQAKADDASKMPAFGLALSDANDNAALQVVTFGTIEELDTSGVSEGTNTLCIYNSRCLYNYSSNR